MCDHEKEICEKNIQQPQLQLGDDQWESVKWKLENYTSGGFGQNREKTSGMELKEWLRMDMTVQHMVTIIYMNGVRHGEEEPGGKNRWYQRIIVTLDKDATGGPLMTSPTEGHVVLLRLVPSISMNLPQPSELWGRPPDLIWHGG